MNKQNVEILRGALEKVAEVKPSNKDLMAAMLGGGVEKEAILLASYLGDGKRAYNQWMDGTSATKILGRSWDNVKDNLSHGYNSIMGNDTLMPDIKTKLRHAGEDVSDYFNNTFTQPEKWGTGTKAAVYGGGGALAAILASLAAKKMLS